MPVDLSSVLLLVGRVLLGGLFVLGGVEHFFIFPKLVQGMTARGVPAPQPVLLIGSVYQLILGVLLMLGLFVAPAALGLAFFTVVASIIFLNFWDKTGPERETARTGVQTNLAIIGGLLIAAAQGW